jgi:hypothetical protein
MQVPAIDLTHLDKNYAFANTVVFIFRPLGDIM